MIKIFAAVLLGAALTAAALFAWRANAGWGGRFGHHGPARAVEYISRELALNDEQRDALDSLVARHRAPLRDGAEQLREHKRALLALTPTNANYRSQAAAIADAAAAEARALVQQLIDARGEFDALLNAQQRHQLNELVARFAARSERWGGRHR